MEGDEDRESLLKPASPIAWPPWGRSGDRVGRLKAVFTPVLSLGANRFSLRAKATQKRVGAAAITQRSNRCAGKSRSTHLFQHIDESARDRRDMAVAGIVEVEAGNLGAAVIEDGPD